MYPMVYFQHQADQGNTEPWPEDEDGRYHVDHIDGNDLGLDPKKMKLIPEKVNMLRQQLMHGV
jgi:hypothetical protein